MSMLNFLSTVCFLDFLCVLLSVSNQGFSLMCFYSTSFLCLISTKGHFFFKFCFACSSFFFINECVAALFFVLLVSSVVVVPVTLLNFMNCTLH